jgi:hypothetical protein
LTTAAQLPWNETAPVGNATLNKANPASNATPNLVPALGHLPEPAHNVLFVNNDTLAQFRGIASAKEESPKKVLLPDIIPGFKASSLDIGEHYHPFFFIFLQFVLFLSFIW